MENTENLNDYKTQTNTQISITLKKSAEQNNLSFTDCMSFGIRFKLAELDLTDYPGSKLSARLDRTIQIIEELSQNNEQLIQENEKLKETIKNQDDTTNSTRIN